MTRTEWNTMFTKANGTWDAEKYGAYQKEQHLENVKKINAELDICKMAYKVADKEGNTFVFGGIENDCPWYRGNGGSNHIFDMVGLTVIQQYAE